MVFRRIIGSLTLLCFLVCMQGCYSNRLIPPQDLENYADYRVTEVITLDGEVIKFHTKRADGAVFTNDSIEGLCKDGSFRRIPISQVKMAYVRKPDHAKTALFLMFITAGLVLLIIGLAAFGESMEMGLGD